MSLTFKRLCLALCLCLLTSCIADHSTMQFVQYGYFRDSFIMPKQTAFFSFKVPQYSDHNEYSTTDSIHFQDNAGAYVSFGPARYDQTIYNIAIGPKTKGMKLDSPHHFIGKWQHSLFQKQYSRPPRNTVKKRIKLDGHDALYQVFEQYVQEQRGLFYRSEAQTVTYMSYIIDYGEFLVFFQAQAAGKGEENIITRKDRALVKSGKWPPLVRLINSFSLRIKNNHP